MREERRVEREAVLPASPDEVWDAPTQEERLAEWLGDDVELDPVEGGELSVRDAEDDEARTGTVETVIERERLAFTWAAPGGDPSRVEFTVEAVPARDPPDRHRDRDLRPRCGCIHGWAPALGSPLAVARLRAPA